MVFSFKSLFLLALSFQLPYQSLAKGKSEIGFAPLNSFWSGQDLTVRADDQEPGTFTPPGDFGGLVSWQDWTSKDGILSGADDDKILYVRAIINIFLGRIPSNKRTGMFWSGGNKSPEDYNNIHEFNRTELGGNGVWYFQWWNLDNIKAMGLDPDNKGGTYWRMVNRVSKALAAGSVNGKAYIYMAPTNCRTIFSPSSQEPMDYDPTVGGQATVGEVWRFTELPTLMRNLNINQIISFYKDGDQFKTTLEWDVNVDTDKPRDFLPDTAMDASPIIFPPEAGRPPMKRREDAYDAADSIVYGIF